MILSDLSVEIRSMPHPTPGHGHLIQNLSLNFPPRTISSIVAPSGAGKTTLLRIIAGIERNFDGKVLLGERLIERPNRAIQLVFQDARLLPWKTVRENLCFAQRKDSTPQNNPVIEKCLREMKIEHIANQWPKTLSGGEEARVALARALVEPPAVLLLDEPFHSVDVVTRSSLQKELLRIHESTPMTIILTSHTIEDVVLLSDVVYILSSNPLKKMSEFQISTPRPRKPNDPNILSTVACISDLIVGSDPDKNGAIP